MICSLSLKCQKLQNKDFFITSFTLKFSAQQEIFEVELVKMLFRKIIVTCKKAFQGLDIVRLYVCDPGYDRSLNLKLLRWPKNFIKKPLKPIFLFSYQHRKKILMFQLFFCLVETVFNSKILIILSGSRHQEKPILSHIAVFSENSFFSHSKFFLQVSDQKSF